MIPKENETYNYFDDGKIRESRKYSVKIKELVRFDKIDEETKAYWEEEVEQCHWLYNKVTDYFIKGRLEEENQDVIFVRTLNNGWFSLGWWGGRLDIDGSLTKRLNEL